MALESGQTPWSCKRPGRVQFSEPPYSPCVDRRLGLDNVVDRHDNRFARELRGTFQSSAPTAFCEALEFVQTQLPFLVEVPQIYWPANASGRKYLQSLSILLALFSVICKCLAPEQLQFVFSALTNISSLRRVVILISKRETHHMCFLEACEPGSTRWRPLLRAEGFF